MSLANFDPQSGQCLLYTKYLSIGGLAEENVQLCTAQLHDNWTIDAKNGHPKLGTLSSDLRK